MDRVTASVSAITDGLHEAGFLLGASQFTFSVPGAGSTWPGYAPGSEPFDGYAAFSADQGQAFRAAIAAWDELIAPDFTEVADNASSRGEVRAAFTTIGDEGVAGYAYQGTPRAPGSSTGDVWISNDYLGDDFSRGTDGFEILVHEIGHTLGLKHPFEGTPLPAGLDNQRYTVMSYTADTLLLTVTLSGNSFSAGARYVSATTPMVLDIAAVQAVYGADTQTRAGNTVYRPTQGDASFRTIYDAGGRDTIDLSAFTRDCAIDLRAGAYSDVGIWTVADQVEAQRPIRLAGDSDFTWQQKLNIFAQFEQWVMQSVLPSFEQDGNTLFEFRDNVAIALGTVIENAKGGSGDDRLIGNNRGNVMSGGTGKDRIEGLDGADTLNGGAGADRLIGGNGTDSLRGHGGKDVMTGGTGADRFIFAGGDSAASRSSADRITDFSHAQGDRIDLSAIDANRAVDGNQAFAFIGSGAFTAAGQLHVVQADGHSYLEGNMDADLAAELVIRLDAPVALVAGDLVL